jgi:hypothetical protein
VAVGNDLERYRILSTIASGGMATVLLAEDELLGRQVALKRVSTDDVRGLPRLRREALLGASINHPNVVAVYDVVDSGDGGLVIVMEYVPGQTLAEKLAREGRLAPTEVCRILDGVAAALDAIHRRGIVHRDVKPPNILLGAGGAVKLADLGIASVQDRTRITSAGTMLGSLRYMAPEQINDSPATPAIDIYALSAVAFEALSGERARREDNALALAHAISTQPPPDLRDVWPAAPRPAAEVLKRGLALDPAERQASAAELVHRLREAFESNQTVPVRGSVESRPVGSAPLYLPPPRRSATPAPAARAPESTGPASPMAGLIALEEAQRRDTRARRGTRAQGDARYRERPPRRSGRALIAPALLLIGAVAAVSAVVLDTNTQAPPARGSAAAKAHRSSARQSAGSHARTTAPPGGADVVTGSGSSAATGAGSTASATPSATAGGTSAPSVSAPAGSPAAVVQSFYELAAAHRYSEAWVLADPAFRTQLGGYASFESGQSGDRSITFTALRSISQSAGAATVSLATTSVRTDGTHHCRGTVDLQPQVASGWAITQIHINCS